MAKILNTYNGLTPAQIVAKASNTCTLTVAGATVDCTDITVTKIKNVIGGTSTTVGSLCTSGNVNKYSGFSPREWYISGNVVYDRPKTPYSMGNFAGYNHNAGSPFCTVNPTFNLASSQALQSVDINVSINISEANFSAIQTHCLIVVDGTILNSFPLSSYNPLTSTDLTITTTAPVQGGTKTLNISVWLGTAGTYVGQLVTLAKSTVINVGVAPLFANCLIVDSAANRTAVDTKCLDGSEYCNGLEVTSNTRTVDSANLYGYYTVTARLHNTSDGSFSRYLDIPDRVIRMTVSAYKVNAGNTSATYTIGTNLFIINDSSSFSYTIPAGLLAVADNDMFYTVFDTLY